MSDKPKVLTFIGTRPEIIKMSPLLPEFDQHFNHLLVHSGQHYSADMDAVFFEELELKAPDFNLNVGSDTPVNQVARFMTGLEPIAESFKPDAIIVHGDTNTTLAGALVAVKMKSSGTKLIHVEAGCRSGDLNQAEENNRIITDSVSDLLLAPDDDAVENLRNVGIPENRIIMTGNTVASACFRTLDLISAENTVGKWGVVPNGYAIATFHRQENVDNPRKLKNLVNTVNRLGDFFPVITLVHPRTEKKIKESKLKLSAKKLIVSGPVGYKELMGLLSTARFCLTDSGGLQEESGITGKPTLVLRDITEHKKYIRSGINILVGVNEDVIIHESLRIINDKSYDGSKEANTTNPRFTRSHLYPIVDEISRFIHDAR